MPTDFSKVSRAAERAFGRPFAIAPVVSQPNAAMYEARGAYSNRVIDYSLEEGVANTINVEMLSIHVAHFAVMPRQGDKVVFNNTNYQISNLKVDGQGAADIWLVKGE